jgi:transcriptional antiterminator NusG
MVKNMSENNGDKMQEDQNTHEEIREPIQDSTEAMDENTEIDDLQTTDKNEGEQEAEKLEAAPLDETDISDDSLAEKKAKDEQEISEVVESISSSIVEEASREASSMLDLVEDLSPSTTDESEAVEEAVEPPVQAEPDDGRAWYVLHCYSGYENKVRHNLEQRIDSMGMKEGIFDVVVPTEEEIEVKDGKRKTVERRVFPGYILVNMVLSEESWYVVRNTPGVTSFVGQGNEPQPLRPEEVATIIKRMEADAPRIKVTFKQGERVRIVDGPFNDFRGTVDEIDMERAKVRVMVNFFGRETPVELDFLQVEKA